MSVFSGAFSASCSFLLSSFHYPLTYLKLKNQRFMDILATSITAGGTKAQLFENRMYAFVAHSCVSP